jgi:hypothetical protein
MIHAFASTALTALADGAPCVASMTPGKPVSVSVVVLSMIACAALVTVVRKKK